ncbi:MAG: Spy/CpxP family protein refolding chaperone [Pseudomonadota bacterium]
MKHQLMLAAMLAVLLPGIAAAQQSAYAGRETRTIKALSAEETQQYLSGAGMSYAQAAELNRYPGPMHVLELEKPLALTPAQRAATQQLMDTHKAEARAIGAQLVAAEQELDRLFASGELDDTTLAEQVKTVAALQGEYRLAHLETHRRMRPLLNADQVARYAQLRGYSDDSSNAQQHRGTHQH